MSPGSTITTLQPHPAAAGPGPLCCPGHMAHHPLGTSSSGHTAHHPWAQPPQHMGTAPLDTPGRSQHLQDPEPVTQCPRIVPWRGKDRGICCQAVPAALWSLQWTSAFCPSVNNFSVKTQAHTWPSPQSACNKHGCPLWNKIKLIFYR